MPKCTIKSTAKAALKEYDQKSALYQTMYENKSFNRNPANHALYHALMEALIEDENSMDKGVADTVKDHKRKYDDDDDDDDPPAGPNQGKKTKRRRTKESKSSKKPSTTKETPKGKASSKVSKTGKSASAKESVEESIAEVVMDDAFNTTGEDVLYKFKEGNFVDLHLNDIDDMMLLAVQHKLFHLNDSDIVDFIVALHGTLNKVRDELHHRILDFRLGYNDKMSRRKWTAIDKKRSELMVELIDKQMRERRIIRNLERLVSAREFELDYKLMTRASPSSEVMPLTYQEHSPRERPGLDEKVKSSQKIQESKPAIPQSESSNLKYLEAISLVRGGVPAKSSQSSESSVSSHIRDPIYLDSGCSRNMTGVKSYLHKYVEQQGPKVVFGDNSSFITKGYGSINCSGIIFSKVAFVNGLKYSLISISQLCDTKYIVQFNDKKGTIFNANKEIVLIAPRRNDVYVLDMLSLTPNGVCFFAKASEIVNCLWHKRLSHLNFKNINKLAKQNKVFCLPLLAYSKDKPCSACAKVKHHRASFKTKQNLSIRKCLHLLYMDLFGPVSPTSINHEKYTPIIVDEYSRYTWVYFLRKKSQTVDVIMSFIRMVKNRNDVKVKQIRTDNGIEFRNYELESFCDEKGISHKFSSPYKLNKMVITPNEQTNPLTEDTKGPPNLINTEGTLEQAVKNEQNNSQTTKGHLRNNAKTSLSITELSVPIITQSPITHHASPSVNPAPRDRWSRDQHNEIINIIGEPTEGMFTRSMAAKLIAASEQSKTGYSGSQEERNGYVETFAPVASMEAIMIFLGYATYMNFIFFQIDVKSAFLNGKLKEEVYVKQPPGFKSSKFTDHDCKLDKALYGLKQVPRACASIKIPMDPINNLGPDLASKTVNETLYRGMIGSLMYLIARRLDI
ncbi:retrovirus-related pol polyprotein from transposon TNT 1-94 [Tanacetum coccineum]